MSGVEFRTLGVGEFEAEMWGATSLHCMANVRCAKLSDTESTSDINVDSRS